MSTIGIAGQARSGKTTSTNYLLSKLDNTWVTDAFANPIKVMLGQLGVNCADEYKNTVHPVIGLTPRALMQTLGTEWGRNAVDNDLWVKLLHHRNLNSENLVISDIRAENEADYVRERGGLMIHLRAHGGIDSNHASEQLLKVKSGDIVINNDGTLGQLYQKLDEVISTISSKP